MKLEPKPVLQATLDQKGRLLAEAVDKLSLLSIDMSVKPSGADK